MKLSTEAFKDQQMGSTTAPVTNLQREKQETASRWLSPTATRSISRGTSRDLKRIDIVEADTTTGEPRVVGRRALEYLHRDCSRCG